MLAPVPCHLNPPCAWPFNLHVNNVPCAGDIVQKHKNPVRVAFDLKLHAAGLLTCDPPVFDRNNAGLVEGNLPEHGLGKVKMLERGVAPITIRLAVVRGTEVGCSHTDFPGQAPFWVVHTLDLIARTTGQTIVEKGRA